MPHYFFDPALLKKVEPNFRWQGNIYFCAGVYACRRNVISFKEWLEVESWGKAVPGLFSDFGDMGPLNYLVHAKAQRNEIVIGAADLQHVPVQHGIEELRSDCAPGIWRFPLAVRRPRTVHFCGRKPFLYDRKAYSRPFTIARLEHYRRRRGELGAWLALLTEDCHSIATKAKRRLTPRQAAIISAS